MIAKYKNKHLSAQRFGKKRKG